MLLVRFLKYGFLSVFAYIFLFFGTYFLTDIMGIRANISYLVALTLAYILNYILITKLVFSSDFGRKNFILFGIYIFVFWILNNIFFNVFYKYTNFHYLVIAVINIAIFSLVRFLTLDKIVFKK
jgi:putative flippase GtrA